MPLFTCFSEGDLDLAVELSEGRGKINRITIKTINPKFFRSFHQLTCMCKVLTLTLALDLVVATSSSSTRTAVFETPALTKAVSQALTA